MNVHTLLLAALVAAACASTPKSGSPAEFRSLVRGYQTGLPSECVTVVRDAETWRALWAQHAGTVVPRPDAPEVDFARDMVVCVTVGTRPTAGYAVTIERVVPLDEKRFQVEVTETKPTAGAILPQVVTLPYHMVVVPRLPGQAELVGR